MDLSSWKNSHPDWIMPFKDIPIGRSFYPDPNCMSGSKMTKLHRKVRENEAKVVLDLSCFKCVGSIVKYNNPEQLVHISKF